jgi:hypothetical protein
MKRTAPTLLLLVLVISCAAPPDRARTDPDAWLEGVAAPGTVDPAEYPWTPPEELPPDVERVEIREISRRTDVPDRLETPGDEGALGGYAEDEIDYVHDDGGVWYGGFYYPDACFIEGDWEDGYFEEDGCRVPGGVLLGAASLYDPSVPCRPYRGHHGEGTTGYREVRQVAVRRPGDRGASGTRTGPAPGYSLPDREEAAPARAAGDRQKRQRQERAANRAARREAMERYRQRQAGREASERAERANRAGRRHSWLKGDEEK